MSTADPTNSSQELFAPLLTSHFASLTTFKRNGQGISTPMGFRIIDGKGYFVTYAKAWKVKRMANNPRVTLAPCTRSGKVTGSTVEGTIRRLEGSESQQRYIQLANPLNRLLFGVVLYRWRFKSEPVMYEVTFQGNS
jgi:PPOX class probable F420-dependent enzyme